MANQASTTTFDLVDGSKVVVPDSLENITAYVLQEQGDWFEDEIKFLRGLVKPGNTVVDVGANYGVYALSLARKVGPSGQVWAFEPSTHTAQLLEESAAANGTSWLKVLQQALSDRQGTAWLQMPGQSELNSLASLDANGIASDAGPGEAVPVTTLDSCLEQFGWGNVDVLKIDAEGEEERILRGGARFFQHRSPLVMFEVKAGVEVHLDLVDRFQELGYQCFYLIPGLDALAPFDPSQGVDGYLLNLFAAKPDRIKLLAAAGKLIEATEIYEAAQVNDDKSWAPALSGYPYVQSLTPQWLANTDQPNQAVIRKALAAWSCSQNSDNTISTRYRALSRSHCLLAQECQPGCPATRWASLARVALAFGKRQQAMQCVSMLLTELQGGNEAVLDEPFLCPDQQFEAVDPRGQLKAWLESAGLTAAERFSSYSGFFTGESASPRLERLMYLGFANDVIRRRVELVNKRFCVADPESSDSLPAEGPSKAIINSDHVDESASSIRAWLQFLELEQPIRCIDVGALALNGKPEPWVEWAQMGCAEVLGFEPLQEECEQLNAQAKERGMAIRYLPWALGDGNKHTLHITNEPMTSSLFKPARPTIDLFPALGEIMQVIREEVVKTRRLDDIKEAQGADFIKLDVQGAELMILQNAQEVLRSASVVQCEVEFIELYEGQPLMSDVDAFLRTQGFAFLRFDYTTGRPFKPLQLNAAPLQAISQTLWADAIYVRDFRRLGDWNSRQLRAASFILHELYDSVDLVAFLLAELDRRSTINFYEPYLSSLIFGNQALGLSHP